MIDNPLWWQRGIIYQIYPRSFMDSNGDGVGDLPGIIGRLDYLAVAGRRRDLALADLSLADGRLRLRRRRLHRHRSAVRHAGRLRPLLAEAHARGLKVILDFVPNHTSDQHPWFLESRASRDNPKRDWYIWRDPAPGGGPPNNWLSVFGGSAWEWDAATGQYYSAPVPHRAARPELAQPGRRKRRCSTCCASGSTAAWTASAST